MSAVRVSAPWVLPMDRPPVRDGAVLVGADGKLAAVGPDAAIPAPPGVPRGHLPGAVILPGLVNVHTHLELTGLESTASREDFPQWLGALRRAKAARSYQDFVNAAREGLGRCWRFGVTTVADTGDTGAVLEALHDAEASGIVYHEVFGPDPRQEPEAVAALEGDLDRLRRFEGPRIRLGVSPHAPYSVSGALYRSVGRLAVGRGLPVAVHIAESDAESRLLASNDGPFAEAWRTREIPPVADPSHAGSGKAAVPDGVPWTPVAWIDHHGVLGPRTLCIHAVQVSPSDIQRIAARGAAVAHCRRSNRNHGHGSAPLDAFLRAGVRVGIGTDSELSVESLDLLSELRGISGMSGGLSAAEALRLATLGGAEALGLDGVIGSLSEGKWGDFCAVAVPPGTELPEEQVLHVGGDGVTGTWLAGRRILP